LSNQVFVPPKISSQNPNIYTKNLSIEESLESVNHQIAASSENNRSLGSEMAGIEIKDVKLEFLNDKIKL
jgi:hypothetical protein